MVAYNGCVRHTKLNPLQLSDTSGIVLEQTS